MRVGCHDFNWIPYLGKQGQDVDLEPILEEVVAAGFDAVEFSGMPLEMAEPERTAALLKRLGLGLIGMTVAYHGQETPEETLKQKVRFIAELGGTLAVFMAGAGRRRKKPDLAEEDYRETGTVAEKLAEYAASLGVDTVVHNHLGTVVETSEDLERFLKYTGRCGLCLDTGHLIARHEDPAESVRTYRRILRHVHIKDCALKDDGTIDDFVELGAGNHVYSMEGVLSGLRAVGYEGWVVVEQDRTRTSPLESAWANRQFLREQGL